jgi:hypothetical protein
MIGTARRLAGAVAGRLTGGDDRSAAAKAAETRKRNERRRSDAAKRSAATRKADAQARSDAAKRGAKTRARKAEQREARVDAMVEATRED